MMMTKRTDREREELGWYCALLGVPGLGRKKLRELYHAYGSFAVVGREWRHVAAESALPAAVITRGNACLGEERAAALLGQLQQAGIGVIGCWEAGFPPLLQAIPDPPLALFYKGDWGLAGRPGIGVVGSRRPTSYGRAACTQLVKQLCEAGVVIVSGLAYGIDADAHRTALRAGGATIGVLGCGIDVVYPPMHRSLFQEVEREGLLLSEHPPGVAPIPGLFPERNRIISGLALGVLVVEAAERSGSLVTADCALEQGREVFAVPGPIFSEVSAGPHNLIKQGAKLVTGIADVLDELSMLLARDEGRRERSPAAPRQMPLEEEEQQLLSQLTHEPVHVDELHERLAERGTPFHLYRTLLKLESKQVIASLPGGYYVRR
ncbi:DNA-processing protein DprA [Brevibacillus composti]|nr:DNA-processing protein DprA [Brevibacillus composti]